MNKAMLAWTAIALSTLQLSAQTTRQEMMDNPRLASGVYLAYPEPVDAPTPAPKGYAPFYVSHYSRHGSRYLISDRDYQWVTRLMEQADSAHALTPLGCDVLSRLEQLAPLVDGRSGDLTPIGERQHQDIARRMAEHYPQVFQGERSVSARSTPSHRCAMSMAAFVESLKSVAPQLHIRSEISDRYVRYLNWHSDASNRFTNLNNGPLAEEYRKFEARQTRPDRLMRALFADSMYVVRHVNPHDLMWGLYWIAVDMQDVETDVTFDDVLTPDELFDLWQVINYRFYVGSANHAEGRGIVMANAAPLLRNIIETADEAIARGDVAATLRFGHDGNVIPLLALMHIEGFDAAVSRPEQVYRSWCDFRAVPMAANVQMVFYRNHAGHVLVRLMHNEREVSIPVATDLFPYYDWQRVRDYYMGQVLPAAESLYQDTQAHTKMKDLH
ncbi:MAG: histidine-type phosphatase [Prevotella sp.]|nr:histidine-type phosphatase [Prevotella sp.]